MRADKFKQPKQATAALGAAICCGYHSVETAFIYNSQLTEKAIGQYVHGRVAAGKLAREDIFITTKQWRKYHGYDATMANLQMSLRALQVDVIDLYLIHWPGPGYWTMSRSKAKLQQYGPWYFALGAEHRPNPVAGQTKEGLAALRAEVFWTFSAMICVPMASCCSLCVHFAKIDVASDGGRSSAR